MKSAAEELDHILRSCSRVPDGGSIGPCLASPSAEDKTKVQANARKVFVSALAEWVNMHDLHRPYAMGPPSKDMACATVENEHSAVNEKVSCNKLFPRKCIQRGKEEIAEDPRRKALYRV